MADVAEAAQEAAQAAETIVAEAVGAAVERAEIAERTAEHVAEAALEGERGRHIDQLHSEIGTWTGRHQEHTDRLTAMETGLAEIRTTMAEIAGKTEATLAAIQSSSIPSKPPENAPAETGETAPLVAGAEVVLPETEAPKSEAAPSEAQTKQAAKRRRRFI